MENPLADIDRIKTIGDPAERAVAIGKVLVALPEVTTELRQMRQAAVLEMRAKGMSFGQIGETLGIHRNRVQQIADGKASGSRAAKSAKNAAARESADQPQA